NRLEIATPARTSVMREAPVASAKTSTSPTPAIAPAKAASGCSAAAGASAQHSVTASPAPALTPMICGAASGFASTVWMMDPAAASASVTAASPAAAAAGCSRSRVQDVCQIFIRFPPTGIWFQVVQLLVHHITAPLLHSAQAGPGRVGAQHLVGHGFGHARVGALVDKKDEIGVFGQDDLHAQIFKQRAFPVGDVLAAQCGQHLAQHIIPAVFYAAAGPRHADIQN